MPTYEYRCPQGHDFETFVLKISDAQSELPCPTCGTVAGRRVSAGAGLLFKGSGFYITDYGKDGKKDQREKSAAGGAKAPDATGGNASSKADASPAPAAGAPASASPSKSEGKSSAPATAPKSGPAK